MQKKMKDEDNNGEESHDTNNLMQHLGYKKHLLPWTHREELQKLHEWLGNKHLNVWIYSRTLN